MNDPDINNLFLDAFIEELDKYPDHYEKLYGVAIETIKADPEYYYNLDLEDLAEDLIPPIEEKSKTQTIKSDKNGVGFLL